MPTINIHKNTVLPLNGLKFFQLEFWAEKINSLLNVLTNKSKKISPLLSAKYDMNICFIFNPYLHIYYRLCGNYFVIFLYFRLIFLRYNKKSEPLKMLYKKLLRYFRSFLNPECNCSSLFLSLVLQGNRPHGIVRRLSIYRFNQRFPIFQR